MNNSPINILCATDENYVPYCGVLLTSIFENNKDRDVNVFIMVDKPLEKKSISSFHTLEIKYNQTISFISVDKSFLEQFPLKGYGVSYWSIVTYYRLYAAELLPQEVDKVLYLDCDTIVDGSLGELFDMDWSDFAVGTVSDMCVEWQEFYDRLHYDKSLGYFNAGVVFMNLEYWRNHGIGQQCLDFLAEHYDWIFNNDQDVLNYVCRNEKLNLPLKYNYQIQFRMTYFFKTFSEQMKKEVLNTTKPVIIHYADEQKPWMVQYYAYPFREVWMKYHRISLWKSMNCLYPQHRAWATFIKRYCLWPFGLKLKKPEMI